MNKKGFELAISTLIIITLGLLVLIGIIFLVSKGFDKFDKTTSPILDSSTKIAIRESCDLSCSANDKLSYCCNSFEVGKTELRCTDSRLGIGCELDCSEINC